MANEAAPIEEEPRARIRVAPRARPQVTRKVQRQARALGDPTRFEIFRFVTGAPEPVRIATIADRFAFNPSAIRQHLAKLVDAGLLVEELASRSGTGRPPLQYRIAPNAMDVWGTAGPYEFLALRLLEVAAGRSPVQVGVDTGRQLAMAHDPDADAVDVIEAEMASRGFEPRRELRARSVELVLDRCPFEAAASAGGDVVCQIHRGLAEGILEGLGSDLKVVDLIAYNPETAGCRLQIKSGTGPAVPD
jgi:predicted ArsR family transcriptional regulator